MAQQTAYRNPIIPGFNPDPSIIRVEDDYFLSTSTFEYFPGLPIYTSKDLVNWRLIGHALTRRSQLDLRYVAPGLGICAPTLRYHEGRYHMTCCSLWKVHGRPGEPMIPPRGFYVWTDDIWDSSSWSEPIYFDLCGIDQDLFFDDNGKVYLSVASPIFPLTKGFRMGSYTCEVDMTTGRCLSPAKLVRETHLLPSIAEGPHIFKRNGVYYLHTAEGGTETNHQQWIMRSRAGPLGPWDVAPEGTVNPMVYNGEHREVRMTGHMDLVEGKDGRWWAVFLAVRPQWDGEEMFLSQLGRETFLCPVEWVDEWPIINNRQAVTSEGLPSAGLPRVQAEEKHTFSFHPGQSINLEGWYHLRTPLKQEYDLDLRPGSLAIWGGPYALRADEAVTMLLQKQTAVIGEWLATIDFDPELPGIEAGTAAWWSKWSFASIGIRGTAEGRELVFRYPGEGEDFLEDCHSIPQKGRINLRIQAETTRYTFFASADEAPTRQIGSISSRLLVRTREFDSIMTGTHFALYAVGVNNQTAPQPAFFQDVSWVGHRT